MTRRPRHTPKKDGGERHRPASTQASASPGHSAPRWPFALVAGAGTLVYLNALSNPFLFDDARTVVGNPTIRHMATSLAGGPVQSSTAGRPLVNLSLAFNYAWGGLAPFGYHALNLLVVVLCGCLLYALVRRTLQLPSMSGAAEGGDTALAATIAVLWVVHPLHTEVVNYVTQRTESMMALAYLATLYTSLRAMTAVAPRGWTTAAVVCCAAGMACKESMVTAPVVVLLFDAAFVSGGVLRALKQRPVLYGGLCATWLVLAGLIVEGPRFRSAGFSSGVSPWVYLLNQSPLILRYIALSFVPIGLVLDYGEPRAVAFTDVLAPTAFVALLVTASVLAWRWNRKIGFVGTAFFVMLAPTSSFVPIATEVGAERRMFLPLTLIIAGVSLLVWRWLQHVSPLPRRRVAAVGLVAATLGAWATLTVRRNAEYASPVGIWQSVVARWPGGRAHYNFGTELKAAGRRADALDEYRRALPESADAHYALGFELQADGQYAEALEHYRQFVALRPDDINVLRAYHQMGRALPAQGKREDALAAFAEVLRRQPGHADALAGTADTLLALDRLTEAVAAYEHYLAVMPDRPDAMMNLGIALVRLDRDAEAREIFRSVVRLQPNDVAARVNLAYALANTGRYGDSVTEFRRAAELEKDPVARAEIEQAIAQLMGSH